MNYLKFCTWLGLFSMHFFGWDQFRSKNFYGRTILFSLLGGTSSILRTFRAGPVKKHPVVLMRMLESEFNCCCQPDAELFSIHQQPIYITLRNSTQYSAWHTLHIIACKAHKGTLSVRESVSAVSSQNPRHLKFHEHPKTIINKEKKVSCENSGVHFSFDVLPLWADQGSCAHKCVC